MSSQPKVSIIVPVYNTEKYLRKCLDSLINQTLRDIEIVVIDDGSKDHSPEIIQEYGDRYPDRFLTFRQSNSGQAAARNRGIEVCHGEYIGFLDSDDYMDLRFCEIMYGAAKEKDADYAACGYTDTTLDENGNTVILKEYVASRAAKEPRDLYFDALVSPFIHLYRHEVVTESQVKFPEGVVHEDIAFYVNLIPYIKRIAIVESPLAFRLRRDNSTTKSFYPAKVEQIFKVIDCIMDYYSSHPCNDYLSEVEFFCINALTCNHVRKISWMNKWQDRAQLNKKTLDYLNDKFPGYKNNPYLKRGLRGLYIKSYSKYTANLYTTIFRFVKWMRYLG